MKKLRIFGLLAMMLALCLALGCDGSAERGESLVLTDTEDDSNTPINRPGGGGGSGSGGSGGSSGGSSSSQRVIVIQSEEDMAKIGVASSHPLSGRYQLSNDITLTDWPGVGGGNGTFSGTFDGQDHTITLNGLEISNNTVAVLGSNALAGIFPRAEGATVRNLGVIASVSIDTAIPSHLSVGIIAGYARNATLQDITISGNVSVRNNGEDRRLYLGGIAGLAEENTTIRRCRNEAQIDGFGRAGSGAYNQVGGIAGRFQGGTIIASCENTGNISGETAGAGTNVFVGGIAGGSSYGLSPTFNGRIENSWSAGDVHAEGGGYWSWAGGIAGAIVGSGTNIVRSHASGRISVRGQSGTWPYVGGIVAHVFYAALVDQCYFTGDVVVEGTDVNDYAGGIAGYNSRSNSTIRDSWSSGTVSGFRNAGGIVGQNQIAARLLRCYSMADIIVNAPASGSPIEANQGAGGIAGFTISSEEDGLANNVALNPSIYAPNGFVTLGRVFGSNSAIYVPPEDPPPGSAVHRNNYAWSGMTVSGADISPNANGRDGADCVEKPAQAFYSGLGWNFSNVWQMGSQGYPVLRWQTQDN